MRGGRVSSCEGGIVYTFVPGIGVYGMRIWVVSFGSNGLWRLESVGTVHYVGEFVGW